MAEDYNKLKNQILVGNNAKTIRDHLVELENNPKNHQRRWFWELLQNAKDVYVKGRPLKVKLILEGDKLIFMHNGAPFDAEELIHIIFHGSTKDQLEGKTGKFGTGFMTTHLLSKVVDVTGNDKIGAYVDFKLDRSAHDVNTLKEALDVAYETLIGQLNERKVVDMGEFPTRFTYHLSDKTRKVAEDGIAELKLIASTVLAFNDTIQAIEVIENGSPWIINVLSRDTYGENIGSKVVCAINDIKLPTSNLVYVSKEDLQISVLIDAEKDYIRPLPANIPRIFLDFPLFGSEHIGLPIIINSKSFQPLRERTGIYLNPADTEGTHALENQTLITEAMEVFPSLCDKLSDLGCLDLMYLFDFRCPQILDWLDGDFMKKLYLKALKEFFDIPVIPFPDDEHKVSLKSLNNLLLPVLPDDYQQSLPSFYNLVAILFPVQVPEKNEWVVWNDFRQNWKSIDNELTLLSFDYGCTELLAYIESEKVYSVFWSKHFQLESDGIKWLNQLYELVGLTEQSNLLKSKQSIPNQKGKFVALNPEKLNIDAILDEELKDIADLTGWDVRESLVMSSIDSLDESLAPEKLKEFLTKLIAKVTDNKNELVTIRDATRNPLTRLTSWCFDNDQQKLLSIPFIFSNDKDDNPKAEARLLSTEEKILVPVEWWPVGLNTYDQLVSQRFLMSQIYNQILSPEKIQILSDLNVVYLSPLIYDAQVLKRDEIIDLMTPEAQAKLPADQETEFEEKSITVAKLVWFESGDDHSILKRTRDSKKKTGALVRFLVTQLILADPSWTQTAEVESTKGEKYLIHPCFWLYRLFNNTWVSVGSRKNESANAQNMTPYVRDLKLTGNLLMPEVRKFFGVLNISVTDILKNIKYGDSEIKRDEWESAIVSILHSDVDPKDAAAMVNDSAVVQFYKDRKAEREFVENNQQIGKLFEQKFRELFEKPEHQSAGLIIRRVHVGRDYEVAITNDLLNNEKKEELFEVAKGNQKLLLELKATKMDRVGMTTPQVELALKTVEENGLYTLVVFPYITKEDITLENVEQKCRFVVDIAASLVEPYSNKKSLDNKVEIETHRSDVAISCRYEDVKFSIMDSLWGDEKTFETFKPWLFNNISQSSNAFENSRGDES
jgi:hypothetical protein